MKLVKFIETHRESLKILRENGIKRTDYAEYVDIYHDFKTLRAAPGSKFESVMHELEAKYRIGHTKLWEIISTMDRDV